MSVTNKHFLWVIEALNSNISPGRLKQIASVMKNKEDIAGRYIAYLLLTGKDFPKEKKSRYAVTLCDDSPFAVFYLRAVSVGISISTLKNLYDTTEIPEMIYSSATPDFYEEQEVEEIEKPIKQNASSLQETLETLLKELNIPYVLEEHKSFVRSSDISKLSHKYPMKTWRVFFKAWRNFVINYSPIINGVDENGIYHYDINGFFCDSIENLRKELFTRLKK